MIGCVTASSVKNALLRSDQTAWHSRVLHVALHATRRMCAGASSWTAVSLSSRSSVPTGGTAPRRPPVAGAATAADLVPDRALARGMNSEIVHSSIFACKQRPRSPFGVGGLHVDGSAFAFAKPRRQMPAASLRLPLMPRTDAAQPDEKAHRHVLS